AVGGDTSKLFDALHEAGVYRIAFEEGGKTIYRNPAYDNPLAAGFKTGHMQNGTSYRHPAVMTYKGDSPCSAIKAVAEWVKTR
ncbi:MAG: hypothetical protein ACK4SY_10630, partial [Pyrobaculum sp.]